VEELVEEKKKKEIKWENLLKRCKKCKSTDLEPQNEYRGMFAKGKGDNLQLFICKSCGYPQWRKI